MQPFPGFPGPTDPPAEGPPSVVCTRGHSPSVQSWGIWVAPLLYLVLGIFSGTGPYGAVQRS